MPPDIANPGGVFVSGWGPESGHKACLYLADRGHGSCYWYGALSALGGFMRQNVDGGAHCLCERGR